MRHACVHAAYPTSAMLAREPPQPQPHPHTHPRPPAYVTSTPRKKATSSTQGSLSRCGSLVPTSIAMGMTATRRPSKNSTRPTTAEMRPAASRAGEEVVLRKKMASTST
eukprot:GHRQ01030024.1.p2 GENE.GHRQ01030024.1~~GHRQ01030024.1.p2  ORF type:complete len:109 (-),score=30.61 GHRQ01030024.1:598-924(-)